ncbi:MAG: hypothetical protein U1C49_01490 [Candidatus Andersenbacteria bacterium]|nr:hypothetical protein [bacterium]MDZ4225500.1 hypothetical protein [Candidatus Andersenbacteria bacterium]
MIHYFYGEDTYGAREEIAKMSRREKTNIRWLDEEDLVKKQFSEWLDQARGLFGNELIVVRDPSLFGAQIKEQISKAIKEEIKADCVLWDRQAVSKRPALAGKVGKGSKCFDRLPMNRLVKWTREQAVQAGGEIEEAAAGRLISWLGSDRWRLKSEAERLALGYTKITEAVIDKEIVKPQQAQIFEVLDALVRGQRGQAIRGVEVLLEAGDNEFYLLSMLAYQFRVLLLVKRGLAVGKSQSAIAAAEKINPYAVKKSATAVGRYSDQFLADALTRIVAMDFAIKQGKIGARTGLMMLVMGLGRPVQ